MDQKNKFYLILAAIIGLTAVGITGIACHYHTERVKAAFAAGYEEGTVPGNSQVCWIKTK